MEEGWSFRTYFHNGDSVLYMDPRRTRSYRAYGLGFRVCARFTWFAIPIAKTGNWLCEEFGNVR